MRIRIGTGKSQTIVVDATPYDTVRELKVKIEALTGISVYKQNIIYGGTWLLDIYMLRDYSITQYSTLHLVAPPPHSEIAITSTGPLHSLKDDDLLAQGPDSPPFDAPFPLDDTGTHGNYRKEARHAYSTQTDAGFVVWKDMPKSRQLNTDLAIVDPQAYYHILEKLESDAARASEWFRTHGTYEDSLRHDYRTQAQHCKTRDLVPEWLWVAIDKEETETKQSLKNFDDTGKESTDDCHAEPGAEPPETSNAIDTIRWWMDSLRTTYFMLCRVIITFDELQVSGFCTSYYSILLEQENENIAQIAKVPRAVLENLKRALEEAMALDNRLDPIELAMDIEYCCGQTCDEVLQILQLQRKARLSTAKSSLQLLRELMLLLDLGLVSYACSHASHFDWQYLHRAVDSIEPSGHQDEAAQDVFRFSCRKRRLACLNDFLDDQVVWTFRCTIGQVIRHLDLGTASQLLILTRIEEFADIWGPVWSMPTDPQEAGTYRYHNVSKGVICRVDERTNRSDGSVRCHWYAEQAFLRRRSTLLPESSTTLLLKKDDLMLIGANFRDNPNCHYSMDEFTATYHRGMAVLGTEESKWEYVERQGSLSFSKVVGVQISGIQKRRPRTSLKEMNLARWMTSPETALVASLNQYLGVEISHCTGNARRIPFKRLLTLRPLQEMLNLHFPDWDMQPWGIALLAAAQSANDEGITCWWRDHRTDRTEIGKLITYILRVLDKTGNREDGLVAALFHNHRESSMAFEQRYNEYSCMLGDSCLMATYAVVSDVCIECHTREKNMSVCGDTQAWTALETRLELVEDMHPGSRVPDWVLIDPSGYFLKTIDRRFGEGLLMVPGSNATKTGVHVLSSFHNGSAPSAIEISDCRARSGMQFKVFLRSRTKSYGGMKVPRKRIACPPVSTRHDLGSQKIEGTKLPMRRPLDSHAVSVSKVAAARKHDGNVEAGAQISHEIQGPINESRRQQGQHPQSMLSTAQATEFSGPQRSRQSEMGQATDDDNDPSRSSLDVEQNTAEQGLQVPHCIVTGHGNDGGFPDNETEKLKISKLPPNRYLAPDIGAIGSRLPELTRFPEQRRRQRSPNVSVAIVQAPVAIPSPPEEILAKAVPVGNADSTGAVNSSIVDRQVPSRVRTREKLWKKLRRMNKSAS